MICEQQENHEVTGLTVGVHVIHWASAGSETPTVPKPDVVQTTESREKGIIPYVSHMPHDDR